MQSGPMGSNSYLTPDFAPFQSSGGICRPSTDYRDVVRGGGKKKRSSSKKKIIKKKRSS